MVDRFSVDLVPPKITSFRDADAEITKTGAKYSYQVAKVVDGRCEKVAGTNTEMSLPLASIFKLYVLYALSDAVKAHTVAWTDPLPSPRRRKPSAPRASTSCPRARRCRCAMRPSR